MSRSAFGADVSLDLVVNFIPLSIVLFFVVLFAVFNPWGFDPLASALQFAVMLATATALLAVTYAGARAIEGDVSGRGPEES